MANRRRRRQEKSGISGVLYAVIILALLVSMGYLFYYSRSQSKERQEYIKELESKEAATKSFVTEVEVETETESETETVADTEVQTDVETDGQTEVETETDTAAATETGIETEAEASTEAGQEANTQAEAEMASATEVESNAEGVVDTIMILNGTGKSGVAAYWKRILIAKGYTHIVMADYKGTVEERTVVYLKDGGDAPVDFYSCFPTMQVQAGEFTISDDVKIAAGQQEYDSYDAWIVVGKDDALHD